MKKFVQRIDRFCILHPNFGIRNLMLYIVIGNLIIWIFSIMDTTHLLQAYLSFSAEGIFTKGQVWRLVTFALVPNTSGLWLFIALYFYYFIGSTLEREWGSGKFTIYYFMGILLTVLYGTLVWLITKQDIRLSASYINLSMFFAFATMFPDTVVLLFFIIPIKMKWLALMSGALFLVSVISNLVKGFGLISLLPIVAILNYLIFCGDWLFDYLRPARVKQRKNTIDFKKAAKKYNKMQAKKPYTRKCEVCGKTDTDYPNLEFRFCSRCMGYHCFCIDHINNHIHFTE